MGILTENAEKVLCPCGRGFPSQRSFASHNRYCVHAGPVTSFWAKVKKTVGGCWLWQGCVNTTGYGMANWTGRKNIVAHRLSWSFVNGPIPKGLNALHKCDRPRCVNPDHIFLGTQKDNAADCISKGRHTTSAFTPEQVREIRELLKTKMQKEVAKMYGISSTSISKLALGITYRHVK